MQVVVVGPLIHIGYPEAAEESLKRNPCYSQPDKATAEHVVEIIIWVNGLTSLVHRKS